ncbi:MAG TPA: right-handed parallel beta-helix repeat-containing protein [Acidobacteriaceae bacterium]|nr:right-handed parallel beta-helix repeat-containing protein [Acidobacteriaceae bacterium]
MKKLMCGFAAILLLASASVAKANDIYIAQSAVGSANGTSCANAYAYSYFNTGGNWTAGTPTGEKIGPGSTVHVCGTITVGANTEALVFQGSGTSSAPVTLYFESGAVLSSPEWPPQGSGGAVDASNQNYVVINGNGGAGGATQGVIEATATGDTGAACPGGSCTYHNDSNGIEADSSNYLTVEGLSIIDMYVTTTGVPSGGGGACMWGHGSSSNWTITNNLMHDVSWCINLQYDSGTSSNITISNNQIYNIDHGIAIGGPASGNTLSNVNIYGNNIHDYSDWDTPGDVWHHDGIHIWGYDDNGSDTITGVNIYNNKFGGCIGQNVTAHVFMEANGGNTKNVQIYNNSFIDTCNGADNDGMLTTGQDGGYKIYNNTFIGTSNDYCVGTSSSPNTTFVNNVVSGCGTLMYVASGGSFAAGGLHNNIYANCTGSNCFAYLGNYNSSFSSWQSETGQDASPSAYVSSANLSTAGVPQTGSAVIGAGTNLTSLSITTLDSDIAGTLRPATGAWTVGAYSATSGTAPAPPTGLTGTVVTN